MTLPRSFPGILLLSVCSVLWNGMVSADSATVKIGDGVGDLRFKDIRYLERSLADFSDSEALVIICTNTTCPLVRKYVPKLKRLEQEYRDRGVQFLSLNVSSGDSIRDVAAFGVELGIPFPCIKDIDNRCITALGVQRTPEVAVIDANRRLRYRGRIDDQYRIGGSLPKARQNNLRDALEAVLADREIAVTETPVDGCVITSSKTLDSKLVVTFNEHVAPLIRQHCTECHRANTEAPFVLTTYGEVRANAAMIAEVVRDQGTRFECVAHYDNSAFNPFNPDPTATVKDGPQTYHEMLYGFVFYTAVDEDLDLSIDPKTGSAVR